MADESTTTTTTTTTTATGAAGVSDADFAEAAGNPQSFSVEGLSQTNRSLTELIAADKYLRGRARMAQKPRRHPLCGLVSHIITPSPSGI